MGGTEGCIETVRSGDNYYLLDKTRLSVGPLSVMHQVEYRERIADVHATGNSVLMFADVSDAVSLTPEDFKAHAFYVREGLLDELPDGGSFTAYADQRASAEVSLSLEQ